MPVPSNKKPLRPPAVPLIACDPYFSVWSQTDKLTEDRTTHWSGSSMPMFGQLRVDGVAYRFAGGGGKNSPQLEQTSLDVLPTRTIYAFSGAGVKLELTFTTPALPEDLDVLSWPVTYVSFKVESADGKAHDVSLYYDVVSDWSAAHSGQKVAWSRIKAGPFETMRVGTTEQPVLDKTGCDRIDWGHLYVCASDAALCAGNAETMRAQFAKHGTQPAHDDLDTPRSVNQGWPVLSSVFTLGAVTKSVEKTLVLAYDDVFSVELFHRRLPGYWRKTRADFGVLLREAFTRRAELAERCKKFDEELLADLRNAGGEEFARLCALSHRQHCAANKLAADYDGSAVYFSKENYSGGFIATVDVIYPAAPFCLLFNPDLLKAQLTPVFQYSQSGRWPYPFAPHDLGDYPKANGQTYGGTHLPMEYQMPVEESGNMLILVAAIAKLEGHANYAQPFWNTLKTWAGYLEEKGLDPENQLCTDDFMGHMAHNANLSIKATLGIGAFSLLCELSGKKDEAARYRKLAEQRAKQWVELANDGDHYRLAFDQKGSWSQKYNLVWDKLLELNLFPAEVARKEVAYYLAHQDPYGLPLDSRAHLCKNDWTVWSATLAEKRADFEALIAPLYKFADETTSRVALTDCYWSDKGVIRNFQARSVVGGFFIKLLADGSLARKWRDRVKK